ncbi:MAG: hypothetical protein HY880_00195 [Deltaproteobacteria bacterium]|nr:hypothetical protein [Deltaproteobacteria bacterium]
MAAEKIKAQARIVAQQEIKKAKEEIRAEVVTLAIDMAEGLLRKEITEEDHKRLIKEYIDRLKLN